MTETTTGHSTEETGVSTGETAASTLSTEEAVKSPILGMVLTGLFITTIGDKYYYQDENDKR
jgi:hypothetical protein